MCVCVYTYVHSHVKKDTIFIYQWGWINGSVVEVYASHVSIILRPGLNPGKTWTTNASVGDPSSLQGGRRRRECAWHTREGQKMTLGADTHLVFVIYLLHTPGCGRSSCGFYLIGIMAVCPREITLFILGGI